MLTSTNEQSSATLIQLLNTRLADTIDLVYRAKQAHWNVTGRDFFALHQLFDKVAHEVQEQVDEIAERVAQLGGEAEGTVGMVAERSSLPAYPHPRPADGPAHIVVLSSALGAAATSMHEAIDEATRLGDLVTADIFTDAARELDKMHWMVRAHSTDAPTRPAHVAPERRPVAAARPRH